MLLRHIKLTELDNSLISDIANQFALGGSDGHDSGVHTSTAMPSKIEETNYKKIEDYIMDNESLSPAELKDLIGTEDKDVISAMVIKVENNCAYVCSEFLKNMTSSKPLMQTLESRDINNTAEFAKKVNDNYDSLYNTHKVKINERISTRSRPVIRDTIIDPSKGLRHIAESIRVETAKASTALSSPTPATNKTEIAARTADIYIEVLEYYMVFLTLQRRSAVIQEALATYKP